MDQPHQSNIRDYNDLLRGRESLDHYDRVFDEKYPNEAFYVAGYTLCEIESFIQSLYGEQDNSSAPTISFDEMMSYKHHLLLVFKIRQSQGEKLPQSNSGRNVQKYCDNLLGVLSDQTKKENAFHDAVSILKTGLDWYNSQEELDGRSGVAARRTRAFTNKIIDLATNSPMGENTLPRAIAANPPSQPMPDPQIASQIDTLTGTIVGFAEMPSQRSNWLVYVSASNGETRIYEIARRDVAMWNLDVGKAEDKVIHFVETRGSRGDIRRAQIRGVS